MPDKVTLLDPNGQPFAADPADVPDYLRQGFRPLDEVSQGRIHTEQAKETLYNSPEHTIKAFGQGINRGLTFGLSDLLVGDKEEANAVREQHGWASGIGETVGAVAGGLAGLGERAVALPASLSARAARAAAAKVAGAEASRGAAQKIVGGAIEAAVDGGLYGGGQAVSDAVLGDDPLTIDRLAASIGTGALMGGAIGGGLGAVSAASGAIRKRLAAKANPLLNPRSAGSKELSEHIGRVAKDVDGQVDDALNRARIRRAADIAEEMNFGAAGPAAKNVAQDNIATNAGRKSPGAAPAAAEEATAVGKRRQAVMGDAAGVDRAAETVPSATVAQATDDTLGSAGPNGTAAYRRPAAEPNVTKPLKREPGGLAALKKEVDDLEADTIRNALPEGAAQGAINPADKVATQVDNAAGLKADRTLRDDAPLGALAGAEAKAAEAEAKAARSAETVATAPKDGPLPGEDWFGYAHRRAEMEVAEVRAELKAARRELRGRFGDDFRVDMAQLVRKRPRDAFKAIDAWDRYAKAVAAVDKHAGTDLAEQLRNIGNLRSITTEETFQAANRIAGMDRAGIADALKMDASALPKATSDAADMLLKAYAVARFAEDFGAKAAVRAAEAKVGGAAAGAMGAAGALAGGLPGAAAAAVMWALGRPQASMMRLATQAGRVASKVYAGIDAIVQRATGRTARRIVNMSAQSVLAEVRFSSDKEDTSVPVPVRRLRELQHLAANPGQLDQYLDDQLAALRAHNLDVGFEVANSIRQRLSLYIQKMPQLPPEDPFTGFQEVPSDAELEDWSKYVAAGEDPTRLLAELQSGDLTPETVEAVQAVYPALFGEMQQKLAEAIPDLRQKLDYADRLNLSLMFDMPVEQTATDDMFFSMQEMYSVQEEEQAQQSAKPMGGTPKPHAPTKGQLLSDR